MPEACPQRADGNRRGAGLSPLAGYVMPDDLRLQMEQRIASRARLLFDALGERALICTRRSAANHEAGHAVVFHAEGEPVRSVRIFKRNGEWGGWTSAGSKWRIAPDVPVDEQLRRARILFAGLAAELLATQMVSAPCSVELEIGQTICASAADQAGLDVEDVYCGALLDTFKVLAERRRALGAIAEELYTKRHVKGPRLAALLGGLDG